MSITKDFNNGLPTREWLGRRLTHLREGRNLTQAQLSEELNSVCMAKVVSEGTFSDVENPKEKKEAPLPMFQTVCYLAALDMSPRGIVIDLSAKHPAAPDLGQVNETLAHRNNELEASNLEHEARKVELEERVVALEQQLRAKKHSLIDTPKGQRRELFDR